MNDKQPPVVSVIVTTYNREQYLKETIQSILNQTFADFELIVVDNFSNYNFFKTIEGFNDSRIKAFQNQNNGVIAVNRNYGISMARGKYLAFCDDDDLWMPDKLEKQLLFVANYSSVIVSSYREIVDDNNSHIRNECWSYKYKYSVYYRNKIALSSVLVTNSSDVRFDESRQYFAMEDYCLWLKLYHLGYKIKFCPYKLIRYREGHQSSGSVYTFLPPKEISYLSAMVVLYKDTASIFHYVCAVICRLYIFIKYLLKEIMNR